MAELARCHVHAMPSIHDAFGVAHIEAMAAGVPTIGGEGTGAEDIAAVGPGIALVPPGDVSALARSIDRMLSDPSLGDAARETAVEHFSWAKNAAETFALYQQVAGAIRSPR